ncbi:MAG: hypothetical protein ACK5JT_11065 [Hyphomicrobiaceae bacterium]
MYVLVVVTMPPDRMFNLAVLVAPTYNVVPAGIVAGGTVTVWFSMCVVCAWATGNPITAVSAMADARAR